jgi:hypothetical protein
MARGVRDARLPRAVPRAYCVANRRDRAAAGEYLHFTEKGEDAHVILDHDVHRCLRSRQ